MAVSENIKKPPFRRKPESHSCSPPPQSGGKFRAFGAGDSCLRRNGTEGKE
ncbi:MAG: hypothetical protein ACR2QC_02810 [Gammaproteobacteria bacterium]